MATKFELEQTNAQLAAEVASLRAELSALKVTKAATATDEEEFPDFASAMKRCRELSMAHPNQRFVQRGCRVICKLR